MVSSRSSSPVAALAMRTWRSETSMTTWVRAWVRPMPRWWEPAGHAQGDHAAVVDAVVADAGVGVVVAAGGGLGLGEGAVGGGGVARWARARCGRWWL